MDTLMPVPVRRAERQGQTPEERLVKKLRRRRERTSEQLAIVEHLLETRNSLTDKVKNLSELAERLMEQAEERQIQADEATRALALGQQQLLAQAESHRQRVASLEARASLAERALHEIDGLEARLAELTTRNAELEATLKALAEADEKI